MNFDEIIAEYKKRGITFSPQQLKELKSDEHWIADCTNCDHCGCAILHDDELYVCNVTDQHLCDKHSTWSDALDETVTSIRLSIESSWDEIHLRLNYLVQHTGVLNDTGLFIEWLKEAGLKEQLMNALLLSSKMKVVEILNYFLYNEQPAPEITE